jgi:SpoVK/Ycf46/Vps4 family AAA+-type ATPase
VRNFAGYGDDEDELAQNMAEVFKRARMAPTIVVLEDLDSMINDKSRSFFLNELDGFRVNTGVVVHATTKHPENLDTAILDRPSRFDRKYYFDLPAERERSAYVRHWNRDLQPELRVSERAIPLVINETEGFSFAYLKELFVASMAHWMSTSGKTAMDDVILAQAKSLRAQMSTKPNPFP